MQFDKIRTGLYYWVITSEHKDGHPQTVIKYVKLKEKEKCPSCPCFYELHFEQGISIPVACFEGLHHPVEQVWDTWKDAFDQMSKPIKEEIAYQKYEIRKHQAAIELCNKEIALLRATQAEAFQKRPPSDR